MLAGVEAEGVVWLRGVRCAGCAASAASTPNSDAAASPVSAASSAVSVGGGSCIPGRPSAGAPSWHTPMAPVQTAATPGVALTLPSAAASRAAGAASAACTASASTPTGGVTATRATVEPAPAERARPTCDGRTSPPTASATASLRPASMSPSSPGLAQSRAKSTFRRVSGRQTLGAGGPSGPAPASGATASGSCGAGAGPGSGETALALLSLGPPCPAFPSSPFSAALCLEPLRDALPSSPPSSARRSWQIAPVSCTIFRMSAACIGACGRGFAAASAGAFAAASCWPSVCSTSCTLSFTAKAFLMIRS
mmetsp:Transcript_149592/g.416959  ORF Transcript_149592/g.416959 Transcript_149592/m.416959 type:complete len:310 (-) Transcript_149592:552-1481(-)